MSVNFVVALALFNMASVRAGRVLLTLYAIKLGAQPAMIGMLAAAFSVVPILFSQASGRWSDRFGSRWPLLFGVAGSSSGMLLPFFFPDITALFVAGVLSGVSMTFCNVSLQNLVGVLSTAENRVKNFGNYTLAGSSAAFLGPLIAGFAIDHAGYHWTCLIVIAVAMVPMAMLVSHGSLLPRGNPEVKPGGSLWQALSTPGVWPVLVTSCLAQTVGDFFQFYMPVYAHDAGLSASAIGVVLAAYSAATFVARIFLPGLIQRWGEQVVLIHAFSVAALGLVLVPLFKSATLLGGISFLTGLGMGCVAPITLMLMFTRSAAGRSGEALGLRLAADNLTRLVAPMLFGVIASAAGLGVVFWLNALMLGSGGAFTRHRSTRKR